MEQVPPGKEGLLQNQGRLPLALLPGPRLSVSCPLWSELGLQERAWLLGVRLINNSSNNAELRNISLSQQSIDELFTLVDFLGRRLYYFSSRFVPSV